MRFKKERRFIIQKPSNIKGTCVVFFLFPLLPPPFCVPAGPETSSPSSAPPASMTHLPLVHLFAFRSAAPVSAPGLITRPLPLYQLLWELHPLWQHLSLIALQSSVKLFDSILKKNRTSQSHGSNSINWGVQNWWRWPAGGQSRNQNGTNRGLSDFKFGRLLVPD